MAAELTSTKLNAESHLLLDQSLLKLPHELVRKTFKTSQREVEHTQKVILANLKTTAEKCMSKEAETPETLTSLDNMIARMQGLKRKLEVQRDEEKIVHESSRKRIQHLQDLYNIPSLTDVKYDEWSRIRLDRLLVDYLLRSGYIESAKALAKDKGIEELVDTEVFMQCNRIQESLKQGRTVECLTWCSDNKQALKKLNNKLEFEVRLQQYIELVRSGQPEKLLEATRHARKYLSPFKDSESKSIHRAAGLLAFSSSTTAEPYRSMFSSRRWTFLANLFLTTHHTIVSLPARPLLHIALSAGLSSLKTPACHASHPAVPLMTETSHHATHMGVDPRQSSTPPNISTSLSPGTDAQSSATFAVFPPSSGELAPGNNHTPWSYAASDHLATTSYLRALIDLSGQSSSVTHTGASSHPMPNAMSALAESTSNTRTTAPKPAPARVPVGSGHHLSTICPICSTELRDLARNVPYAHHTKSYVENDPVVLPNGRIYGRERLVVMSPDGMGMGVKLGESTRNGHGNADTQTDGDGQGKIRDPVTGELFFEHEVHKVYIS